MGSLPGNQLAKTEKVLSAGQDLTSLVRSQALAIEGVENVLNESIGDLGGEVGFRKASLGDGPGEFDIELVPFWAVRPYVWQAACDSLTSNRPLHPPSPY